MQSVVRKIERDRWSQSHGCLGSLPAPFLVHGILSVNPFFIRGSEGHGSWHQQPTVRLVAVKSHKVLLFYPGPHW